MIFQATEDKVKITGRTLMEDGVRYLGFSGSSISFRFRGKKASAVISTDAYNWTEPFLGRIAVYVNDSKQPAKRITLKYRTDTYVLYESENEVQDITLTIMKYSEAPFGKCGICSLEIDSDTLLPPPEASERKMEIIGDSITCGYGVEAKNESVPFDTVNENPAKSYSLLTAGKFGADAYLISWSGNGITSHYVEETALVPRDERLMPEVYRYTDISGSAFLHGEGADRAHAWERWDFSRFRPDIILVNLGTNDCSWCRDIPERKRYFQEKYLEFLRYIRANNEKSEILCMLGTMDQRLNEEVKAAVMVLSGKENDSRVHFLQLPPQDEKDGYGTDWHPSGITHQKAADIISEEIRRIMGWEYKKS